MCFAPEESYLVTKKSDVPVRVAPSSEPLVYPATYTLPEVSTAEDAVEAMSLVPEQEASANASKTTGTSHPRYFIIIFLTI